MNKKKIMLWAALFSTFIVSAESRAESNVPNIIYILCDDLGFGDVGICNPNGKIPTPNMDRLGREGLVFTDAHSNSSVCTPTRYGVLTGRYAWRTRLKGGVLRGFSEHLIDPERMTVASLLKDNGYHTAYIGKWHLGWDWQMSEENSQGKGFNEIKAVDYTGPVQNGPNVNGFDYAYGHCGSLDMPPYVYVENGLPTAVPDRNTVAEKKNVGNGWWRNGPTAPDFEHRDVLPNFTRRAVKYVEERAHTDKPFFLYLPFPSPHTPVLPTAEYKGMSGIDSAYADFTYMTDDCIGQVMEAVEKSGIADNTMIIVTSDNGCSPEADFTGLKKQGHNPSYIYRGHKADIFEGGHRVPFIVRWPAKVEAGSVCNDTTCLTDMLATCADIVGVKLPADAGEDSVSMLPNLLGTAGMPLREATVHHSINGTFAIRQGKWKLIDASHSGGWSFPRPNKDAEFYQDLPKVQLYDMEADPGETTNVQDKHPETVERLKKLLEKYKQDGRSTSAA